MTKPHLAALALSAALVMVGCGSSGGDKSAATTEPTSTTASTTTGQSTSTTRSTGDDGSKVSCPDAAAVEELLGGPVDRTASGGSVSSADLTGMTSAYSYQGCSYELTDGGQGEVSVTRIVDHEGETEIFEVLLAKAEADFSDSGLEEVPDLGEAAVRVGSELAVLTGDVIAFFEVTSPDDEPLADLRLELAEAMLSEGGGLLTEPELDCDEIGAMAPTALGTLDYSGSAPGTSIVDNVTLQTEGCLLSYTDDTTARVAVAPGSQWDAWLAAERNSSFTTELIDDDVAGHPAFDDGDVLIVNDDADRPLRITADGDDLEPNLADLRRLLAELALQG